MYYGDIIEKNGKTIKENNFKIKHKIPFGTLVETKNKERLYVCTHTRDCDGTPLYGLCLKEDLYKNFEDFNERLYSSFSCGYSEECLKVISYNSITENDDI